MVDCVRRLSIVLLPCWHRRNETLVAGIGQEQTLLYHVKYKLQLLAFEFIGVRRFLHVPVGKTG